MGDLVEVERLGRAAMENVKHVLARRLEVSSRIVRARNKAESKSARSHTSTIQDGGRPLAAYICDSWPRSTGS